MLSPLSPSPPDPEEPRKYTVRIVAAANLEMLDAYEALAQRSGDPEAARQWYLGFKAEIGTLATLPHRFPVRPDESRKIGRETRRFLYQRPPGGVGHHAYFVIEEDSMDGPLVTVIHLRHARRAPMTEDEGRDIAQRD
jgi:hypothetical protein